MSRKLPGSAIVPGTITVTQITGGLQETKQTQLELKRTLLMVKQTMHIVQQI